MGLGYPIDESETTGHVRKKEHELYRKAVTGGFFFIWSSRSYREAGGLEEVLAYTGERAVAS